MYFLYLRLLKRTVAVSNGALHAFTNGAAVNATYGDTARVVRVVERGDEHLRSTLKLLRSGDYLNNLVEQVVDIVSRRFIIFAHPTVLSRTIYDGEVKLVLCSVKVAHEVEHHFVHLLRTTVRLVHLINYNNGFKANLECLLQDKACLGHRAFKGIDQKDAAVGHIKHTFYLTTEVGVTRSVDNVDFSVFITDRNIL